LVTDRTALEALVSTLLPIVGDIGVNTLMCSLFLAEAHFMNLPWKDRKAMITSYLTDALVGSVPVAGDVLDFLLQANTKSANMCTKFLDEKIAQLQAQGVSEVQVKEALAKSNIYRIQSTARMGMEHLDVIKGISGLVSAPFKNIKESFKDKIEKVTRSAPQKNG